MLNAADDPKAEEARRLAEKKRNAYFAELEKESTAKGKRSKKAVASKDLAVKPAKPLAGSKMAFPVGLKKTSNIAMKGVAAPAAAEKKGTGTATTAGDLTTITGIPPPPEEDPPLTDDTDEADANKYVRFTVPSGCGGEDGATHVRVQVPGGQAGAGPVVEVELPIGAKEGDALEAEVTAWDASDVPPPAPPRAMGGAGVSAGRAAAAAAEGRAASAADDGGGRVPAAAADGDGDDGAADGNGDGDGRSAAAAASAHGRRYGRSADGGYDDGYAAAAAAGTDGEYSGHGRAATAAAAEIVLHFSSSKNRG